MVFNVCNQRSLYRTHLPVGDHSGLGTAALGATERVRLCRIFIFLPLSDAGDQYLKVAPRLHTPELPLLGGAARFVDAAWVADDGAFKAVGGVLSDDVVEQLTSPDMGLGHQMDS